MQICKKCGKNFPTWVKIDGKARNLCSRKRCLECSPFGKHNTNPVIERVHKCGVCGETNLDNFYGQKKSICGKCHCDYTVKRGQENKQFICEQLGGKCILCGFNKYNVSLDVHHINPEKKDLNFKCKRGWSKQWILAEIKGCVLLCRNCHAALHAGLLVLRT